MILVTEITDDDKIITTLVKLDSSSMKMVKCVTTREMFPHHVAHRNAKFGPEKIAKLMF